MPDPMMMADAAAFGSTVAMYDPNGRPWTYRQLEQLSGGMQPMSEQLPFGLGHPIKGWWPVVGEAVGNRMARFGVRYGAGRNPWGSAPSGSGMFGRWAVSGRGDSRLYKEWLSKFKTGGTYDERFQEASDVLSKARGQTYRTSTGSEARVLRSRVRVDGRHFKPDIIPDSFATPPGGAGMSFQGRAYTQAEIEGTMAGAAKRAVTGTRIGALGTTVASLSRMALGAQLMATGFDLANAAVYQATKWKPNRFKQYPLEFAQTFADTNGAATQRQRAIMAIHESQMTTRAAIGNEAPFMHL